MARYNQYNRNRLSLNTVDFQPTVLTPIEFRPVEQDYSILERATAKQEERKEKAVTQQSLVKQALGKAREQLHQDDETLAWFDAKARKIEDDIKTASEVGDYATALQTGIEAAGDITNDTELNARKRTNAQYKEEYERQRQRIGKGIGQATFDWWVKTNPYTHENIHDKEGRVTGAQDWKAENTPVDDLNASQLAFTAFKLLSPEKSNSSGSSNVKPGTEKEYNELTSGYTNNYEKISVDRIYTNINEIMGSDPNNWRAARQGFQVALNELDKLKEERDAYEVGSEEYNLKNQQYEDQLSYFRGENNQDLSNTEEGWKLYTARIITDNMFAKGLAYDWKTVSSIKDVADPRKMQGDKDPIYPTNPSQDEDSQSSPGNPVRVKGKTFNAREIISNALGNANKQFESLQQSDNQ